MHIDDGTWVLVADGGKLTLFQKQSDSTPPALVRHACEEITNPPTSEQGSDRPGRSFSSNEGSTGQGERSSGYGETDWHRRAKERFAIHAADILNRSTEHEKGSIIVIAPAQTLGVLRKHYSAGVAHQIKAEIAKDLAGRTSQDIVDVILAHQN